MAAASAIAAIFFPATSAVFMARLVNVAKPQSGFRNSLSAGTCSRTVPTRWTIASGDSTSAIRGIHDAEAERLAVDGHELAGARGRVLEHQLIDVHLLEVAAPADDTSP